MSAGIQVNGAADILTGVHTWNLATGNGGTGIQVNGGQNRFDSIYLDWTNLVMTVAQANTVVDSFFLCGGHLVLQPQKGKDVVDGVYFAGNVFSCVDQGESVTITINTTAGDIASVNDMVVAGTVMNGGFTSASPSASLVITATQPTKTWTADFSKTLLFDTATVPIKSVQYSFILPTGTFVRHAARPANGAIVTVETEEATTGTLTISVDQSSHSA